VSAAPEDWAKVERLVRRLIRHWRPDLQFSGRAMHEFAAALMADGVTVSPAVKSTPDSNDDA